jgi:hypothetical protein
MRRSNKEKAMAGTQPEDVVGDVEMTREEFQRTVDAAVERRISEVLAKFSANEPIRVAEGEDGPDFKGLFRQMAMSIAEVGDQGSGRRRVAPEIMAARRAAKERMIGSIEKFMGIVHGAQDRNDRRMVELNYPHYKVTGKMYLGDTMLEPFTVDPVTKLPKPVEVYWLGAPNPSMSPINAPAREIFAHFCDWVGLTHEGRKEMPLWISAGGLVIAGETMPAHRLAIPEGGGGPSLKPASSVDALMGKNAPASLNASDITKPKINVLGTIAAAATQSGGHAIKATGATSF